MKTPSNLTKNAFSKFWWFKISIFVDFGQRDKSILTPLSIPRTDIPKSQLSVIVVPIGFCLLAVILVVFGVAYYIQNRERFIVEVADFNFGDTSSLDDEDMEYKTFQQRLFDSLRDNLRLPRFRLGSSGASHDGGDGDMSPSAVGESSLRYGSMTWGFRFVFCHFRLLNLKD